MLKPLKLSLILTIFVSSQTVMGDVTFKVVSSNTPTYPVNKMLTEKTKISLQQGDEIQVEITKDNEKVIYTFDGPYNAAKKSGKKSDDGLIETIKKRFSTKLGATTKAESVEAQKLLSEKLKDMNLLVVLEDRNFCYASDTSLKLWRLNSKEEVEVSINGNPLDWEKDKDSLEFPIDQLPKKGNKHLAKIGDDYSISLYKIPTELISNTSKGKQMMDNGCVRQAKLLFTVK
ncbi:hypothetical protein QUF50_08760 [Thiotrichales bacterium HSG1]|nr:hypothetical protein [Thiotrichales bacterium HSG1]